ncbi:hypothetical protein GL50803_0029359 [Giardia duodenalis]|uniref:Uncharacterized protein n=1 Tax=Giardia intestinalis (strain ATCC 50803 / WB clone C6) TaxID=184922 RepID=A8BBD3_GIAIC|nr:hypothetical protein GL50803_0029359 [Giardia intestinalis]KAE8302031.1 hypothetical protein GL50803_0029359 [Giardia intestinalis]|eukprot:XP_001708266.1 Hypothetical protein GL50803_29359 [Giardia lamblia ATCC 50803]
MPYCSCGKRSDSIYCPLCESTISTTKCPECTIQAHIKEDHPTCTVSNLLNAIKARADNSVNQQEVITERIRQMKEVISAGQDYIRDMYQAIESKFQALKLQWFGRKNESVKKSISSLYNILEERVVFGLMATNIVKDFNKAFQLTLSILPVWSYRDLLFKLSHSGSGCIIRNVNAEAYAWKKQNKKVSRKDQKLLRLINPTPQEYSIGMWPLETILSSTLTTTTASPPSALLVDKSSPSPLQTKSIVRPESLAKIIRPSRRRRSIKSRQGSELSRTKCFIDSPDLSTNIDLESSVQMCITELELSTTSIHQHAVLTNNILGRNASVSKFGANVNTELQECTLSKGRPPPRKCIGYFMSYPDIVMSDTTSLFGSFLSEEESRIYIKDDPIYQLCAKEISWMYQAIATIIANITSGIAATMSDLVVLGSVHAGQLSILKNVRAHTLVADCPSLIERCYVENGAEITGSMNLFIADAVFGDDSSFNGVDHNISVIRFSIFEGQRTSLQSVKLVANCVFTGPVVVSGNGVYVSCHFSHLTLGDDFVGQFIGCHVMSLTIDPSFNLSPLMFHKSIGPGLLGLSFRQDKDSTLISKKSSSSYILPEEIDINILLNSRQTAYTRLIETNPATERMDSVLDRILAREYSNSAVHVDKQLAKANLASIPVDINLSGISSNSKDETPADNLLDLST